MNQAKFKSEKGANLLIIMSFNNQGVISIENQENYENKVISSQSSDNSSGSKRKPKLNQKNMMKSTDKQLFGTPSSTQSTISTQSDRTIQNNDSSVVIHAIEYGLEVYIFCKKYKK